MIRAATYEICATTVLFCAKLLAGRNINIHKNQQFYEQKVAHRIANRQSLASKEIVLAAVHTAPTDKKVKR